ncbi:MAG TPA: hypothetical protein VEK56_08200 [Vicinamibacterales bacterium]|nr:hypothetical protein [Vicinamibacterales bacterium]
MLAQFEIASDGVEKQTGNALVAGFSRMQPIDTDVTRHVADEAFIQIDEQRAGVACVLPNETIEVVDQLRRDAAQAPGP